MAVGLLWILDAANNTAMEPYRAFIADRLPVDQRALGFLTQSFFTGLGITLANVSLYLFQRLLPGHALDSSGNPGIPYWVYGSFFVGAFCSIGSVAWSVSKTPELPPDAQELRLLQLRPKGFFAPFIEIAEAIKDMPAMLWQLALVYLFQWYAMFCYWQFISHTIAKSVWHCTAADQPLLYEQAVGWTGLVNGCYNVVTFMSAFFLVGLAKKYGARNVHATCLLLASISLMLIPGISNKYLLFLPMVGFGIAWASMMGVPYIMVVNSIPKERYGVYMGIVNMMIVVPMILQTLSFGFIHSHFLGNNPGTVMIFAGILLLLAALATLRIHKDSGQVEVVIVAAGH